MRRWAATAVTAAVLALTAAEAAAAANRPFPQHTRYVVGSVAPNHRTQAQLDTAVRKFYDVWKRNFLRAGCGSGRWYGYIGPQPSTGEGVPISVSEAQGYAMLIVAIMGGHDPDAQKVFDGLYRFYKDHPSQHDPALMAWRQLANCKNSSDPNSATDGDLDIAAALVLADRQWGTTSGINYRYAARQMMAAIRRREVHPTTDLPQMGDWNHPDYPLEYNAVRTSDIMPRHFRTFLTVSGDQGWRRTLDAGYRLLDEVQTQLAPTTGLVPDFVTDALTDTKAAAPGFNFEPRAGMYAMNACRVPWRIASDYLISGDARAKTVAARMVDWTRASTGDDIYKLYAEYHLDGRPNVYYNYVCTTGALGVAAMVDARNQAWVNRIWDDIAIDFVDRPSDYYGYSLRLIYMLVMSRNWWAY